MSSIIKPVLGSQLQLSHPLARGLVGCWLMNEGSGIIVQDLSGNGNAGTFVGTAPSWIAGKFGSAVLLPGTDEYINVSSISKIRTVSIWVLITTHKNFNRLFDWRATNEFSIFGYVDGEIQLRYNGVEIVSTTAVAGEWNHFVGTHDGTNCHLYKNGVYIGGGAAALDDSAADFVLGTRGAKDDQFLNGQIDNAMIWNRYLYTSEIAELYREPFCMFERDPIELWSAATLGAAPPVGMAGAMTTNTGYWGY